MLLLTIVDKYPFRIIFFPMVFLGLLFACTPESNEPPRIELISSEKTSYSQGDTLRLTIKVSDDVALDNLVLSLRYNEQGISYGLLWSNRYVFARDQKNASITAEIPLNSEKYDAPEYYINAVVYDKEEFTEQILNVNISGNGNRPRAILAQDESGLLHYMHLNEEGVLVGTEKTYSAPYQKSVLLQGFNRPAVAIFHSDSSLIFGVNDSTGQLLWTKNIQASYGKITAISMADEYVSTYTSDYAFSIATAQGYVLDIYRDGKIIVKYSNLPGSMKASLLTSFQCAYGLDASQQPRVAIYNGNNLLETALSDTVLSMYADYYANVALVVRNGRKYIERWRYSYSNPYSSTEVGASAQACYPISFSDYLVKFPGYYEVYTSYTFSEKTFNETAVPIFSKGYTIVGDKEYLWTYQSRILTNQLPFSPKVFVRLRTY